MTRSLSACPSARPARRVPACPDPVRRPRIAARAMLAIALTLTAPAAWTADPLVLNADQIARLGIELAPPLPAGEGGSLQRLPARVIVPPRQLHVVGAPVAGLVTQVAVAPGQAVRRNEVLLRIASASVAELRRGLAQAEIQARQAERTAQRDRQLQEEGLIAEARLRASEAARDEARLMLAERQAALRLSGATAGPPGAQDEVIVRAPVDGVVMESMVSPSSRIESATPLLKLAAGGTQWLEVELPLRDAPRVSPEAWLTVDGVARRARGLGFAPEVASGSQTVTLRAQVQAVAGAPALRPGQFVMVDVAGERAGPSAMPPPAAGGEPLWRVPVSAIVRIDDRPLVFARTAEGFRAVPVALRATGAAEAVVAGALSAQDRIAVGGASSLKAVAVGVGGR